MACDGSGLLATGSHSGVINLLQTGRHAAGITMRLLPPHPRLSTPTDTPPAHSAETPTAHDEDNRQREAPAQGDQNEKEARVAVQQQLHGLSTRVEAAIQLNSSLEPQLQLSSEELLLNTDLKERLITQGRSNIDAVRQSLVKAQTVNEIKALHLKEFCWDVMAVPAAQMLPVGQISLSCGLADYEPTEERTTRFATSGLAPVNNMPIRKLSQAESLRLQQVQSLRQAECEEVAVTDASTGAHTVSATSSASVFGSTAGETIAACAEAQPQARMVLLNTPDRQLSQAVRFQQEACLIREAFNQQFDAAQTAKKDLIAAVEERWTRISKIQRELGLPSSASTVSVLEDPAPEAVLTLQDSEVKADRWVSPQQMKKQQAEQMEATARSSDVQQAVALRGVRQMLGDQGSLQGAMPLELSRQPWMDLPDATLTPTQRAVLKEHDKKVQDWTQQQERHKAALETEIKTLRSQIGEACFAFDDSLVGLHMQRTAAESELTTVELQLASLLAAYEQQLFLQSELEKVARELSRVGSELHAKQALVSGVTQALIRAQSHVEEVQPQGRAVDKAFKRELGPLPYYPDLLVLYQDRSRGYTYQADFQATELDEMLAAPTMVSQQQQQRMQAPVLGVPFVQRILYERNAAAQPPELLRASSTASPDRFSLIRQPSTMHSSSSAQSLLQASFRPPAAPATAGKPSGRYSRSASFAHPLDAAEAAAASPSRSSRMSVPSMTSRSSSLKPKGRSPEDALLELRELGPLGIPPCSPSDADSDPFAQALVAQAFTDVSVVAVDPEALSGALLSSEDMPSVCKPEVWARLIALRDAKISLETDTAQLHNTVQLLTDQLQVLQEEEALLATELTAAEQAHADLVAELEHHQSDVQLRLALQNGQVEAADTLTHPLTDHSAMLLLHRQAVVSLNSTIISEGQARLEQQKAVWAAERQALLAQWEHRLLQLQIQKEQAHLEDMHLLHLSHDSPYRTTDTERVLVKKESTAALMRKQQARQQAGLASVFEKDLALQRAVSVKGQENTEQAAVMGQLAEELTALTNIHEPIKGRAGEQKKQLDTAMRQSHAVHVLREISHQQHSDIKLMQDEIARLMQRSKASFVGHRQVQPDIIFSQ
ncbi:Cilia- and flagella-associated protein 43 [Trebouxia sp. C0009 RCD-2024]